MTGATPFPRASRIDQREPGEVQCGRGPCETPVRTPAEQRRIAQPKDDGQENKIARPTPQQHGVHARRMPGDAPHEDTEDREIRDESHSLSGTLAVSAITTSARNSRPVRRAPPPLRCILRPGTLGRHSARCLEPGSGRGMALPVIVEGQRRRGGGLRAGDRSDPRAVSAGGGGVTVASGLFS